MRRQRKLTFLLGNRPEEGHALGVQCTTFLPDGRIVTGGRDATMRVWQHGQPLHTFTDHGDSINDIVTVPNTSLVASCSSDNSVLLFHMDRQPSALSSSPLGEGNSVVQELFVHSDSARRLALSSSNSTMLYSCSLDGTICYTPVERATSSERDDTYSVIRLDDPLFSIAVDDHHTVAAGSANGHLYLFDSRSPYACGSSDDLTVLQDSASSNKMAVPPAVRHAHAHVVRDVQFLDGGSKLVSAGADGFVKVWETRMMRNPLHLSLHSDAVMSVCPLPGRSSSFLSASRDGTVSVTDIRQLKSARVVTSLFPIFHIACSPNQVLYTSTSRSTVDGYLLSSILPEEFASSSVQATPSRSQAIDLATPSKVSLGFDDCDEPSPAGVERYQTPGRPQSASNQRANLLRESPVGLNHYHAKNIRRIEFENKEERLLWCTSSLLNRPASLRGSKLADPPTEPDVQLPGSTHAIVECVMLQDKRHVVTCDESRQVCMWNICSQKLVTTFPSGTALKDAVQWVQVDTYCPSWCAVECRWGSLAVTLSNESIFDAVVNAWCVQHVHPTNERYSPTTAAQPRVVDATDIALQSSVFTLNRAARTELRGMPTCNLGEYCIRSLAEQLQCPVVVWRAAERETENTPRCTANRFTLKVNSEATLKVLPRWVQTILAARANGLTTAAPTSNQAATVSVELIPFPTTSGKPLPALRQSRYSLSKKRCLSDICAEIVEELRLRLPKKKEILQLWTKEDGTLSRSLPQAVQCLLTDPGIGNGADPLDAVVIGEEYLQFVGAGEDGQPSPLRVIDPLMTFVTAFFTFKEKGSGTLRVWYRKNPLLYPTTDKL